ncbi:uncharacterized protein EDB91DRAFT_1053748, partial [Suillus paluster]|uniref:uncharacterized protein n=1 Tax=Suillus paluster TaxID=48578 RepID=UPI001B877EA6
IIHTLARPAKVLILDECTSVLDGANQMAILETIRAAKVGKTTIMVTHKAPVMKICDRVLVVEDGQVQALPVPGRHSAIRELVDRLAIYFIECVFLHMGLIDYYQVVPSRSDAVCGLIAILCKMASRPLSARQRE